ncbi:MAG: hypothetical protein U5N26_07635 [Candidatus Marinimicrobia bacterium]|nr:hypothetical protein [Candidatus Neomarinimicrobiota bacterium]
MVAVPLNSSRAEAYFSIVLMFSLSRVSSVKCHDFAFLFRVY